MSTIIECPACSTRYKMNKAIPEGGRSVKCARCGHQWRLVAEEPEELTEALDADSEETAATGGAEQYAPAAEAAGHHESAVAAQEQATPSWEARRGNLAAAIASMGPTAAEREESEAEGAEEDHPEPQPSWPRRRQTGFPAYASGRAEAPDVSAAPSGEAAHDDAAQSAASPVADAPAWKDTWLRGNVAAAGAAEPESQAVDAETSVRQALRAAIEDHPSTEREVFGARGGASSMGRSVFAGIASGDAAGEQPAETGSAAEETYQRPSFAEVAERIAREAGEADARSYFADRGDEFAAEAAQRDAREAGEGDAKDYFVDRGDEFAAEAAQRNAREAGEADAEEYFAAHQGASAGEDVAMRAQGVEAGGARPQADPASDAERFESDIAGIFSQQAPPKRSFGFGTKKRADGGGFTDYDMESGNAAEQADDRYMADSPLDADAAALQAALEGTLRNRHSEEGRTGGGGLALAAAWAVFLSVLSGVTMAFVSFREEMVVALPGTAALYRTVGFDVQDRQVDFGPVTYRWTEAEGKPMIEVTGQIINLTDREISVPRVLVQVHDKENTDTVKATATVRSEPLAARETADFTLEFLSPPRSISQIELAFSETPND